MDWANLGQPCLLVRPYRLYHVRRKCRCPIERFVRQAYFLGIFKKLKARKTQPLKKLKAIFAKKTL